MQLGLGLIGLWPGMGLAVALNGCISLFRGDKVAAGLSFAATIPFAGWGPTGGKLIFKYGDEAAAAGKAFKFDLQFFASKADIKQIQSVAKEFKMTPQQRRAFGDYIESFKDIVPNNQNFSYKQLRQYAKEFMEDPK